MLARADSDAIITLNMFFCLLFLLKAQISYSMLMKQSLCLFATQLQGLVGELREGLHAALVELAELRQRDNGLEVKLQTHLTEVDDKIMGLKNSLNTFKVVEHTQHTLSDLFLCEAKTPPCHHSIKKSIINGH